MRFLFDEQQRLLQTTVREVLQKACPPQEIAHAWNSETGRSPERWATLAELGVVGLTVPERHGGLGLDEIDLVLVLEETGRALLPEPVIETTAVAVPLLRDTTGQELADAWLPRIAAGEAVVTVGLASSALIADAHQADLLLLERDGAIYALRPDQVQATPQPSIDGGRRLFSLEWESSSAALLAEGSEATRLTAAALDRGALGVAAQLLGVARELVDMSVAYASQREQFGRPIGSYQAIKHLLANALLRIELARPPVYRAAFSVARGLGMRGQDVSLAKALTSEAALLAARTALQVHGAIGYTEEHRAHLWMKRAWALASAWGTADWHRERIARAVLDA